MKIDMRYDRALGVVTLEYEDAEIVCEASYEAWVSGLRREFARCKAEAGGKYPLVVGINGLHIGASFQARYGQELAVEVARDFASAIARWGTQRTNTRAAVASQALRRTVERPGPEEVQARQYDANLFDTREEAIAFVLKF